MCARVCGYLQCAYVGFNHPRKLAGLELLAAGVDRTVQLENTASDSAAEFMFCCYFDVNLTDYASIRINSLIYLIYVCLIKYILNF